MKATKKERKTTHVREITTIWSHDGAIGIETCGGDIIIFNAEKLFSDIPTLMTLALAERKKQEEIILELIEDNLKNNKVKTKQKSK